MLDETWAVFARNGTSEWEVSSRGRVRRARYLDGYSNGRGGGYMRVALPEGISKWGTAPLVHRLVAEAFIGPRPVDMEVDHIDGDTKNNVANNLEYVTHEENIRRARLRGAYAYNPKGANSPCAKLSLGQVAMIRETYKWFPRGKRGAAREALAKEYGVSKSTIGRVLDFSHYAHEPERLVQLGEAQ
jgi:hypothetical protein